MAARSRIILTLLALGALACAVVAAWWWFDVDRQTFYTDDGGIRASAEDAQVRDILWRTPEPLRTTTGQAITGRDPAISADGGTLLLSRTSSTGDHDLYIAGRVGDAWTEPTPLTALNSIDNELSPAISADGQRLYFASDRPGGQGGLDIWMSLLQDGRWLEPTTLALNSPHDDTDPHPLTTHGGVELVVFASDRPAPSSTDGSIAPARNFDLFLADLDAASPRRLAALCSDADEFGPTGTPSGDFLYFASEREGGKGGRDLYRARVRADAEGGPQFGAVRTLGPSINTPADELDPSMGLEGFAIVFATDARGQTQIVRAISREVYLARSATRGDLLALLPWILVALAVVLLIALLRRTVRDELWRSRLATLGLMAKCVLASLVVHAGLVAVLAALQVSPDAGQPTGDQQGVRVALSSSSMRSSIAEQMRGSSQPAELDRASTPDTPAPSVQAMAQAAPASASFTVESSALRDASTLSPASTSRESSIRSSATRSASATAGDLPAPANDSPALSMPQAGAPTAVAEAEAGIEAPVRAIAAFPAGAIDQAIAQGSSSDSATPGTIELDAASIGVDDSSTFAPSVSASEASAIGSTPAAPDVTAELANLPSAPDLAPSLALPQVGQPDGAPSDATPAEVGQPPRTLANTPNAADMPEVAIRGNQSIEATLLDVDGIPVGGVALAPSAIAQDAAPQIESLNTLDSLDAAALPMPTLSTPQLALPEIATTRYELLGMVIDDQTEAPIANARVRLDLEGAADLTAQTSGDGSFVLGFDQIPENAALTATHDGYTPGAVNIAQRDIDLSRRIVVRLRKIDPLVIVMEPEPQVRHLGNDEFSGRINSQFQRRSEGLRLQIPFEMTEAHAALPLVGAELRIFVKGTQAQNPVRINGQRIAALAQSPNDGSFGEQSIRIPSGVLRLGENVLEIESVARRGRDFDDFEFVNPRVVLVVRQEPRPAEPID
ncbi:MAG: hypothetical protein RIB58_00560 [Phycisphaerales bacterium]